VQWCHDRGILYVNTSVEVWDPYAGAANKQPTERTLYWRASSTYFNGFPPAKVVHVSQDAAVTG
jgi:homospermidine synthase